MRRVLTIVFLLAGAAQAQVPAQATRLSPEELHFAAYELLLDDQIQKAAVPLEQAYRARPMLQQPRALVLNHALVDVKQKVNAMRAAKDMRDYLRAGPQDRPDENAVDLLGAALVVAAGRNEKIRESELFKTSEKRLGMYIMALETQRPGERKWGYNWYTAAAYNEIEAKRQKTLATLDDAERKSQHAKTDWETAQAELRQYNTITVGKVHRHRDGLDELTCEYCMVAAEREIAAAEASDKAAKAERQYKVLMEDVKRAKVAVPQPDWDQDLRPFDPWSDFQKPRPAPTTRRALPAPPQRSPAGGLGDLGNR